MNASNNNAATEREPSEVELLLPWYAAGKLGRAEAQQVETALANDLELASRYEWVRAEFSEETSINEEAGEPSDRDVTTLFAKIDALPRRAGSLTLPSASLGTRITEFFASLSPRTLAWSATAAALAIVLQAGLLTGILFKEKSLGGYETASAPTSVTGDGAYVLMRFQPQATAADVASFLEANKLNIVGGPFGGKLYRVRVATAKISNSELTDIVKRLQDDKVVGFVAVTE
jgi:hypothetical protein